MKTLKIVIALGIMCGVLSQAKAQSTLSLTVDVQNVENNKGHLIYSIYNSEESFNKGQNAPASDPTDYSLQTKKVDPTGNTVEFTIDGLTPGFYVLTMFEDENDNGKLDTGFLGIPKERVGMSNVTTKLSAHPKWAKLKFEVKDGVQNSIPLLLIKY